MLLPLRLKAYLLKSLSETKLFDIPNCPLRQAQPVDGAGRETAAVGAGLRAAPVADGAAREEDVEEESGIVNRRSPTKGPYDSRAADTFGCRECKRSTAKRM
jgi:hypothetical protein